MRLEITAIKQFLARREQGARYVYEKTYRLVYALCFEVLRQAQDAEDAAMQTYENVLASNKKFDNDRTFLSYLCTTARNNALNIAKKRGRIDEIEDEQTLVSASNAIEDGPLLEKVAEVLGEEDYELVILHLCHELPFPVIASFQGGSASSCRGRYFRALKKLRSEIRKEEFQ